jgi:hypothetical protein
MASFTIDKTIFLCDTNKISENEWKAEISYIQKNSGQNSVARNYSAFGPTENAAVESLKSQINDLFLLRSEKLSWQDVFFVFFRWVRAGGNKGKMAARALLLVILILLASVFFIDFQKGPLTNVSKNYSFIFEKPRIEQFVDTGFLTEQFIANAFKNTKSILWAANVSFRNLQVGNKANLENFLDRKKEFKLVLLDTGSVLASTDFLRTFSRTATKKDINNTLNSLLNDSTGSFKKHADLSIHQLFLSAYSPIVPMMRMDDTIYVSFSIHTDKNATVSNYGGPFLKFHITSKIGAMLKDHFSNMIAGKDTHIVYP